MRDIIYVQGVLSNIFPNMHATIPCSHYVLWDTWLVRYDMNDMLYIHMYRPLKGYVMENKYDVHHNLVQLFENARPHTHCMSRVYDTYLRCFVWTHTLWYDTTPFFLLVFNSMSVLYPITKPSGYVYESSLMGTNTSFPYEFMGTYVNLV